MKNIPKPTTFFKLLCISYIISALLLLLTAFLLYKMQFTATTMQGMVYTIYAISCAIGGFCIGKSVGHRRFFWGLLFGLLYFLILFGLSLLIEKDIVANTGQFITTFLFCIGAGCIGGMIS